MREAVGIAVLVSLLVLAAYYGYQTNAEVVLLSQEVSTMKEQVEDLTEEVQGYSAKLLKILNAVSR